MKIFYRKPKRTIKTAAQVRAEEEAKAKAAQIENKYEKVEKKINPVSTTAPSST